MLVMQGDTPDSKPFCANCGAAIVQPCSSCGAELIADKPFCANCGSPVYRRRRHRAAVTRNSPSRSTSPVVAVAERRLCSVLFVDLVGIHPAGRATSTRRASANCSRCTSTARNELSTATAAPIEKFIGDAVMAVWGAPIANEDDAERAVRAGLDVVASVSDLGGITGNSGLRARGGVVTGEVAITIGKVSEGMVLGDTVNSASRVQSVAEPGTVFVDESTWRAASGAVAFEEVGSLELKGKAVTVQRLARAASGRSAKGPRTGRASRAPVRRSRGRDSPHQGALARDGAREASATGVGYGYPRHWQESSGVGVSEIRRWTGRHRVLARRSKSRVRRGHHLWGTWRNGPNARRNTRSRRRHLLARQTTRVSHHIRDATKMSEGGFFPIWHTSSASRRHRRVIATRSFRRGARFFERIAEQNLTVLIFEDLQWADAGLIDFVESILEWSKGSSILVVTLARPELMDHRPSWGAGLHNFTSLHLEPLSAASMNELLVGFVHGLPRDVSDRVLERAEGVPLYAVETIRMLVDRGVIVQVDDRYEVQSELGTLEIPETLHALIASRLDSLTPRQRALLQDAGIVGSTFSIESLQVVSDESVEELEVQLRDLVRKEFIFADNDPALSRTRSIRIRARCDS